MQSIFFFYFASNIWILLQCTTKSALTTPSLRGWCHPTSSHWAPRDPQVWADTQTSRGGLSRPAGCSSSWWPPAPHRGDTGSWSPGGSRWPSPCRGGRGTAVAAEPLPPPAGLAPRSAPRSAVWDSCWRNGSWSWSWSCCCCCYTFLLLPCLALLQVVCCPDVLYQGLMCCSQLLVQVQKWTFMQQFKVDCFRWSTAGITANGTVFLHPPFQSFLLYFCVVIFKALKIKKKKKIKEIWHFISLTPCDVL